MTRREAWLKKQIELIKAGGTMPLRCTLAVNGRVEMGLCQGDLPIDRAHKGLDTCSPECAADKKRLRRWEKSKGTCRLCGHGLPKKDRELIRLKALESLPSIAVTLEAIPESGIGDQKA